MSTIACYNLYKLNIKRTVSWKNGDKYVTYVTGKQICCQYRFIEYFIQETFSIVI